MWFATLLISLIGFLYLIGRINTLEYKIKQLLNGEAVQPKPALSKEQLQQLTNAAPMPPQLTHTQLPAVSSAKKDDFEFKFGGKLFTIIGAVAVLFGIGFFLRYAFEQDLITETMRVVLGIIAATALLLIGQYLKSKFETYGRVLQGTALGVYYLTLFAAYSYYGLITQPAALLAMSLVSVGGIFLAIRSNSIHLAGVAQFGAFVTPLLLKMADGEPNQLFLYITLVNVGTLLIALWRTWRSLTIGGLLGTAIVYVIWHSVSYENRHMATTMVYLTIFFFTFFSANIYKYFVQKHKSDENDLALVLFNPLFYFLAGYSVLHPVNPDYVGFFTFALSALYFIIGALISEDNLDAKIFHYGVGATMFFIGVPIEFNKQWITVGWAAEALFLMYYGLYKNWTGLQGLAHVVFMVATLRLLLFDFNHEGGANAVLNGRALTFAMVTGMLALAAYLHWHSKHKNIGALVIDKAYEVLVIQAHVAAMFWIYLELNQFGDKHWLSILWSLLSLLALMIAFASKSKEIRLLSYFTVMAALFRLIFFDSELKLPAYEPIFNLRVLAFIGTALILGIILSLLRRKKDLLTEEEKKIIFPMFFYAINLVLLWVISLEITSYFDNQIASGGNEGKIRGLINSKRALLSVAWSLYAIVLLVLGIAWKSAGARLYSLGLFAIVIFKVFLYDTSLLSDFYRFVSFIALGLILLLAGYLYNRYKERIAEFIQANNNA